MTKPGSFSTDNLWSNGDVASSVIEAVSKFSGDSPTEIEPLYDSVDPDALEALLVSFRESQPAIANSVIRFVHDGFDIKIESDGTIEIEDA